jgi:hypothetical protein
MKECVWVKPRVVAEIQFLEWTGADHLRHTKLAYAMTRTRTRSRGRPNVIRYVWVFNSAITSSSSSTRRQIDFQEKQLMVSESKTAGGECSLIPLSETAYTVLQEWRLASIHPKCKKIGLIALVTRDPR